MYMAMTVSDCRVIELDMLTPKILLVPALNVKGWLLLPELQFKGATVSDGPVVQLRILKENETT